MRRLPSRLPLRGSALIVAMWVLVALAGLVLVMAYTVRVEAIATANRFARASAQAAERGAEQFLLSVVDAEINTPGTLETIQMEERAIGDCLIWVLRPDALQEDTLAYGLSDEAARVDLNTANSAMLTNLPGITPDVVDAILDWRDSDSTIRAEGAEDEYYLSLPEPYRCKNGPFESVDELMLVKGVTREVLFNYDRNRNGILDERETQSAGMASQLSAASGASVGFYPYITSWGLLAASSSPSSGSSGSTSPQLVDVNAQNTNSLRDLLRNAVSEARVETILTATRNNRPFDNLFQYRFRANLTADEFKQLYLRLVARPQQTPGAAVPSATARINVNRAARQVLLCLPGLEENDVATLLASRASYQDDPANIAWLAEVLPQEKIIRIGDRVTGTSKCFSADVVAVSLDGRAFTRTRVVINGGQSPARIIYRRDLTSAGWPLAPEIRSRLRAGEQRDDLPGMTLRGGPLS